MSPAGILPTVGRGDSIIRIAALVALLSAAAAPARAGRVAAPSGPAGEALLTAAAVSELPLGALTAEGLRGEGGRAFGEGAAPPVVARPGRHAPAALAAQETPVNVPDGVIGRYPPPGPAVTRPPVEYVSPTRVRAIGYAGAALGAAAAGLVLGFWGAVAGGLVGFTAGAFLGQKIPKPAIGLVAGAAAAVSVGLGPGGLILGALLGWVAGLALTMFS